MNLNKIFSMLLRRHNDSEESAAHNAAELLAESGAQVDAEALALQAAVEANAREAVRAFAGVEQKLNAAYAGLRARTEALFATAVGRFEAELSKLLARTEPEYLDSVERSCRVEQARLEAQLRPKLVAARRTERSQWRALRAFRFRHRLNREARFPESRALHFSVLVFVCVIEAVANTWAFAQSSSIGVLGGFIQASIVAAVNVVFAFFAGRAASGLFHRNWGIKTFATVLVSAWATFESLYALTVAHYRIALLDNVDTAPWMALERIQTLPLAIDDVTSVLLTVFTVAFGVAAMLTGLATDDRFPGYGATTRAYCEARKRLEGLRQAYLSAIDAIYLPAPARLTAITAEATGVLETYRRNVEALNRTANSLEHALGQVSTAHRQAVFTAREAFARVSGYPAPTSEPSPLPPGDLIGQAEKVVADAEESLVGFPSRLACLEVERAAAETRIQRQHAAALEGAPTFFATTEELAEMEFDHDEADGKKALALQRTLWDEPREDKIDAAETPATQDNGATAPPRKPRGNGAARDEDRAA